MTEDELKTREKEISDILCAKLPEIRGDIYSFCDKLESLSTSLNSIDLSLTDSTAFAESVSASITPLQTSLKTSIAHRRLTSLVRGPMVTIITHWRRLPSSDRIRSLIRSNDTAEWTRVSLSLVQLAGSLSHPEIASMKAFKPVHEHTKRVRDEFISRLRAGILHVTDPYSLEVGCRALHTLDALEEETQVHCTQHLTSEVRKTLGWE